MMRKTLFVLAISFVALLNVASAANHPAHVVAMVYGPPVSAVQQSAPVRTFERTALERDVRRLHGRFVVADTSVSPHEGKVYVSRGEGRWHRAGAWRRVQ